jgi:uncharacterized protein DUF1761
MLLLFWMLLFLVGVCLFVLTPSLLGFMIYGRYRGPRAVTCPETHGPAEVQIDALHAGFTGMAATEKLRLASCTLWPMRANCDESCISQAVAAPVISPPVRVKLESLPHPTIHLPAYLVATAAFWFVGAFWYSQFVFRGAWMKMTGFTPQQIRELVELWSPHLVTVGIAALFTFALAWVVALFDCHSAPRGVAAGFLLWLVFWVFMVGVILLRQLPLGLISIHGGYTLLASMAAGAILGGWKEGRIMRWLDREE